MSSWLGQQRATDRDALALAAGKMTRRPIEQGREAKQIDNLVEANRVRLSRASRAAGAIEQVAPHGEMRKQARFLKDVADGTLMRWQEG